MQQEDEVYIVDFRDDLYRLSWSDLMSRRLDVKMKVVAGVKDFKLSKDNCGVLYFNGELKLNDY